MLRLVHPVTIVPLLFACGCGVCAILCFKRWREYPARGILALGVVMLLGCALSLFVVGRIVLWILDPPVTF